ncbi:MAG: T9SS type A sorting domain-containing protein, partial [Salibacteraceae bacterium]
FPEIGRLKLTGFNDVMGVKLDEEGKIWFVDKTAKKVVRIDNENVKKREDDGAFVGMEELSDLNISFYPNPFTSKFSISGLNSNEYSLSIYNISGAEVYRIDQMTSEIDLSEFQSGLYFVHIIDQQGRIAHSEKLVKQ